MRIERRNRRPVIDLGIRGRRTDAYDKRHVMPMFNGTFQLRWKNYRNKSENSRSATSAPQ